MVDAASDLYIKAFALSLLPRKELLQVGLVASFVNVCESSSFMVTNTVFLLDGFAWPRRSRASITTKRHR